MSSGKQAPVHWSFDAELVGSLGNNSRSWFFVEVEQSRNVGLPFPFIAGPFVAFAKFGNGFAGLVPLAFEFSGKLKKRVRVSIVNTFLLVRLWRWSCFVVHKTAKYTHSPQGKMFFCIF